SAPAPVPDHIVPEIQRGGGLGGIGRGILTRQLAGGTGGTVAGIRPRSIIVEPWSRGAIIRPQEEVVMHGESGRLKGQERVAGTRGVGENAPRPRHVVGA